MSGLKPLTFFLKIIWILFGSFEKRSYICTRVKNNKFNHFKTFEIMMITNIIWETDGIEQESLGLPREVELPEGIDADDYDAINDYLSDTYGWLVIDWRIQ